MMKLEFVDEDHARTPIGGGFEGPHVGRVGSECIGGMRVAHLQIRVLAPVRAPLPVTDTGYRSHFVDRDAVESEGGPVEFVRRWLDAEADTKDWRAKEAAARQLSLF